MKNFKEFNESILTKMSLMFPMDPWEINKILSNVYLDIKENFNIEKLKKLSSGEPGFIYTTTDGVTIQSEPDYCHIITRGDKPRSGVSGIANRRLSRDIFNLLTKKLNETE